MTDPSGRSLAEAAHAAGAVTEIEPDLLYDVTLTFVVTGSRLTAEFVGASIEQHGLQTQAVRSSELMVTERAA